MKNWKKVLGIAILGASMGLAQGPGPGRGHGGNPPDPQQMLDMRINMLTRRLQLSDDQKSKATTIYTGAFNATKDLRTSLQTTNQSLRDAVKKNDTASIDKLAATVGTATSQILAADKKADAAFYQILTPEQQAKFDAAGPGMMGGPGGPGPRGFGRERWGGPPPPPQQ